MLADYSKQVKLANPSGEVSEFVRFKAVQPVLEVHGEEPLSTFAGILLLISKLKL